ncbi:MAG: pectinesterase family protein [Lachnospira sp.]
MKRGIMLKAKRVMATAMVALMLIGLMPNRWLVVDAADKTSDATGVTYDVGEWVDNVRTTTWDFSTSTNTSNVNLGAGDTVCGIKLISGETASVKKSSGGLSAQKYNYVYASDGTTKVYSTPINAVLGIPVDTDTTSIEITITLASTNSDRFYVLGNATESANVATSSATATKTLSSAAVTDGYLLITPDTNKVYAEGTSNGDSGEIKIKSITLKETKGSGTTDPDPSDAPKVGESYTLNFATLTGVTKLNDYASDDGVFKVISPEDKAYWHDATHGAALYNGDKIEVKVAGDAIITLKLCQYGKGTGFNATANGEVLTTTAGKATTDGDTATIEYTGEATTITIECEAAGEAYLHAITADNLAAAGNAENFTFWFDEKVDASGVVATGEYKYADSVLTLVGEGATQYTKVDGKDVTVNDKTYGSYKAGKRHSDANNIPTLPKEGDGTLTMFAPAAKGMMTVYFNTTAYLRIHDFNADGTKIGYVDTSAGITEYSFVVLPGHVYVMSTTGSTNNMFYAGYRYVVDEPVSASIKVTNVDATLDSSLKLSVVDAQLGGDEIEFTKDTTSLNLLKGHTYKLISTDGGVKPLVNGKETFTVGDELIDIKLNNVPDETLTGKITGTDPSKVTGLTFKNNANGTEYTATITGDSYTCTMKPGEYTTSVVTTNGGKTYDRVSVKEGGNNVNEVYVEVADPASKRTYGYADIETLKTAGNIAVETGKPHCVAQAGSSLTIPVSVNAKVIVSGYYSGKFTINGDEKSITSNSTSTIDSFEVMVNGDVTVEFSEKTYLTKIEVSPIVEFKSEISVPGDYDSLNAASDAILAMQNRPEGEAGRVTITLTADIFEQVNMQAPYVTLKGNGHTISWYYGVGTLYYSVDPVTGLYNERLARDKYSSSKVNEQLWGGVFFANGNNFIAEDTTFKNTYNYELTEAEKTDIAGTLLTVDRLAEGADVTSYKYKERSNAFYIGADNIECYNCKILSSQDTLGRNGSTNYNYHAYFNNCVIGGNTDYICGEFSAVFDNCELQWKTFKGDSSNNAKVGYITAPKTSPYVFRNCKVTTDDKEATGVLGYYGRTWGANSNCSFINTQTNGLINAAGWGEMNSGDGSTAIFKEYGNLSGETSFVSNGSFSKAENQTAEAVADYIDTATKTAVSTVLNNWKPVYYGFTPVEVTVPADSNLADVVTSDDATFVDKDGNNLRTGTVILVESAATSEQIAAVKAAIANSEFKLTDKAQIIDLSLKKEDGSIVKLSNGSIKVILKKDADIDYTKYDVVVYHLKDDNTIEKLDVTVSDDTISFVTSSLSPFVVDYVAQGSGESGSGESGSGSGESGSGSGSGSSSGGSTPTTGDTAPIALYLLLACLSMVAAFGAKKKLAR